MENLPNKIISDIGKIVGIQFNSKNENINDCKNILEFKGKLDEFSSIVDFMNKTGRKKIYTFMSKVKNKIQKYISEQSFYKDINLDDIKQQKDILQQTLKYTKIKTYNIDDNANKYYLSLDILSANFTALKYISNGLIQSKTWPEYFKLLVPNDIRSSSQRNINSSVDGITTDIPEAIYNSKFLRIFILSGLNKLQHIWEFLNLKMLSYILNIENISKEILVNSDEIIINVKDYNEANNIMSKISTFQNFDIFRIRKFQLLIIDVSYRSKNYLYKLFEDGNKCLVNVKSEHFDKLTEYINSLCIK